MSFRRIFSRCSSTIVGIVECRLMDGCMLGKAVEFAVVVVAVLLEWAVAFEPHCARLVLEL